MDLSINIQPNQIYMHLLHSPPSLRHLVMQGLLPSVLVLGCGLTLPMCGFVRTFDLLIHLLDVVQVVLDGRHV